MTDIDLTGIKSAIARLETQARLHDLPLEMPKPPELPVEPWLLFSPRSMNVYDTDTVWLRLPDWLSTWIYRWMLRKVKR